LDEGGVRAGEQDGGGEAVRGARHRRVGQLGSAIVADNVYRFIG
jgi:hypothetical protein